MLKKEEKEHNHEDHPALRDLPHEHRTTAQKAADILTKFCGSWIFIFMVLIVIGVWIYLNMMMLIFRWDPYPFIVLNLCLSCLAALQAPVILMSQNRTEQRDRLQARYDYYINRKAEKEILGLHKKIDRILRRKEKK